MRFTALVILMCMAAGSASAQLASYEGPASKRTAALKAWTELKKACPRISEASADIVGYGLHVGLPEGTGPFAELARGYDARVVAVVTLRFKPRPKVIPTGLATPHGASLALISSDTFSGMVMEDPVSRWLCEAPATGQITMKPFLPVGSALDG